MILSSGNIVHNLRQFRSFDQTNPDWALEFDNKVAELITDRNHQQLIDYKKLGPAAEISVNSAEHYIPLLYTLALQNKDDTITYANHEVDETLMGNAMRCVRIG